MQMPHDNIRLMLPYHLNGDKCSEADAARQRQSRSTLLLEQNNVTQMQFDNVRLALPSHLNSDKCSMNQM